MVQKINFGLCSLSISVSVFLHFMLWWVGLDEAMKNATYFGGDFLCIAHKGGFVVCKDRKFQDVVRSGQV